MDRLYYNDAYLRHFQARVLQTQNDGRTVYLDRTAFYPTSGGQPHDLGTINGIAINDVVDEDTGVAHHLDQPLKAESVEAALDWPRRLDHMQQHTGQHLLSAVLAEHFASPTVSFHLGQAVCTIDVQAKGLTADRLVEAERLANQEVLANRAVTVSYEDAANAVGLRKESDRRGSLRIVTIEGLDRSACGGTHVRNTAEIGLILLGKTEKVRDTLRIEFVCGTRALRRARRDYDSLTRIAKLFSATLEDTPALVEKLQERAAEADKTVRRLTNERAQARGRELWTKTEPNAQGLRFVHRIVPTLDDELRAETQGFLEGGRAVVLATGHDPAAAMLAASADSGVNAGAILKEVLAAIGGRGGGSAQMAQGSLPDADWLRNLSVPVLAKINGSST